jgi:TIR domain
VKLFLSYASENRKAAEEIALALKADGHEVFFDAAKLEGGENYHQVIREQIAETDLLVFLITPDSVQAGSYTLSELRMAEERWASPAGHVVPVLLEPTPMAGIPAYLRAVTILEPRGNAAAEIAARVKLLRRRKPLVWGGVAVGVTIVGVFLAVWFHGQTSGTGKKFVSSIAESDFVSAFVMPERSVERVEYQLDPTARFAADRGDVVRLERLAFGRLSDGSKAFSVRLSVNNTTDSPILLDLTTRFFELVDDRGQQAELLYFCCEATGETLGAGQQRRLDLIYRSVSGWEGKETTPGKINFRVFGLSPVVRATWSFRPLATAA